MARLFNWLFSNSREQQSDHEPGLSSPWLSRAPRMQKELLAAVKEFEQLKPPKGYSFDMFAAKMALEKERRFEAILGSGRIENWVGIRFQRGTDTSGDTRVSIMISDLGSSVFVGNVENSSPINISSESYDVLARTKVRTPLVFSGQLVTGERNKLHVPIEYSKFRDIGGIIFDMNFDDIHCL